MIPVNNDAGLRAGGRQTGAAWLPAHGIPVRWPELFLSHGGPGRAVARWRHPCAIASPRRAVRRSQPTGTWSPRQIPLGCEGRVQLPRESNLKRTRTGGNVEVRAGDGSRGCAERSPYDATSVPAAAPEIPASLLAQLRRTGAPGDSGGSARRSGTAGGSLVALRDSCGDPPPHSPPA